MILLPAVQCFSVLLSLTFQLNSNIFSTLINHTTPWYFLEKIFSCVRQTQKKILQGQLHIPQIPVEIIPKQEMKNFLSEPTSTENGV